MAFTKVNPVTDKTWTREQLWLAYQTALVDQKDASYVTKYQYEAKETSKLISWPDQLSNLQARWGIHLKEWKAVTKDVAELGRA